MSLLAALGLTPRRAFGEAVVADPRTADAKGPAVDKNQVAYDAVRASVQKLVDGLNKHAQKARIAVPIADAGAKLAAADTHAAKKEWAEAAKRLAEAKTICSNALKLAEQWATYMKQRGTAQALGYSAAFNDNNNRAIVDTILANADALAGATPPNFAAAKKKLDDGIVSVLRPSQQKFIKTVEDRLATVTKSSAAVQAFAKADIDQGRALIESAKKALAANEFSRSRADSGLAFRILGPLVRMVQRKGPFDVQRAKAVAAIGQVKASAALRDRAGPLEAMLKQADELAGYETRKFEEGTRLLEEAALRAARLKKVEAELTAAAQARAAAETELAALDKHPAAAKVAAQREAVRKLLTAVKALMPAIDAAPDPIPLLAAASSSSRRAQADAAAARKLADSLGAASAAQDAAAKPGDAAGLKTALDQLLADGKQARKAPHADQAAAELKRFDEQGAAAAAALKAADNAKAAKALGDAAVALEAARRIQSAHGQFKTELPAVEAALKALLGSPRKDKIKPKLDPVVAALAQARDKDKAHDGPAALEALRRAQDLIRDARAADSDRAAFDTEAAAVSKRVGATKDAAEKAALEKLVADAARLADSMKFLDAGKALKQVLVRMDKTRLDAAIAANPADPQIAKLADKMVGNGGAATVDTMIAALPGGNDTRAIAALAKGRYGMTFTSGPALGGGDQVKAMQAVCAMLATVPDDVRKNSSITSISHTDGLSASDVSGAHNYDDGSITLSGRPKVGNQTLGHAQQAVDPLTGSAVAQLPAAIEPKCLPKDANPVELLSFTAAHEVGHGVDDKRGFMATHGSKPAYGGWVSYGAKVQPLADIIGADARFKEFYKTPEQQQYIVDMLLNRPANPPAAAPGTPAAAARAAFDQWYALATSRSVYERQGDCDNIKIGKYVYHEAYMRYWVGYLADARKQGLTGYQFRAPAEWFAELYAGYRSGKLRDDHPAMDWLKQL
jgi:hypothetical protein